MAQKAAQKATNELQQTMSNQRCAAQHMTAASLPEKLCAGKRSSGFRLMRRMQPIWKKMG